MNKKTKQSTKKAILILISIILLLIILNSLYIKFVIPKKLTYKKQVLYTDFIKNLPNDRLGSAFFGDSHCLRGFNPEYFPNSYNYCDSSLSYIDIFDQLRDTIQTGDFMIDNIVLELDIHSLSSFFREKSSKNIDHIMLEAEGDALRVLREEHNYSYKEIIFSKYLPIIGNGEDFWSLLEESKTVIRKGGWVPKKSSRYKDNLTNHAGVRYERWFKDKKAIDPLMLSYLLKIVGLTEENDVNLIIIKYPVSRELDEYMEKVNISKEEFYDAVFTEIYEKHEVNLTVLDYHDLLFNSSEYFADADHVNPDGARIFSKRVYEDMKEMGLAS